ncbi:MAG: nucleoside deaminase [Bacteroidia bacterium]|nr:nucleoside deaminase [Bacteroidia bacterium]
MTEETTSFLTEAIRLAIDNVRNGGGPFGAIVVKDGQIVGRGVNRVTANNDPTAHAEVMAIRDACAKLGSFQLHGCTLFTSCEPCPMCLGAIYWARPDQVFFAANKETASAAGFDDDFIYQELALPVAQRSIPMTCGCEAESIKPFEEWNNRADKVEY